MEKEIEDEEDKKMEKCVLCGEEYPRDEIFYIEEPFKEAEYISTDEKLIGKPICEHEFEDDSDVDGKITVISVEDKPVEFYFKKGVVQNPEAFGNDEQIEEDQLEEICNIAKSYKPVEDDPMRSHLESPNKIGSLVKVAGTFTGREDTSDISELYDFIKSYQSENDYEPRIYVVSTLTSNIFNSLIDIFIDSKH
ncbi:MAG: hypothetical protein ACP5IV_07440, partial [Caldisericia bacterium]